MAESGQPDFGKLEEIQRLALESEKSHLESIKQRNTSRTKLLAQIDQSSSSLQSLHQTVQQLHAAQLDVEDRILDQRNTLSTAAKPDVMADINSRFQQLKDLEEAKRAFQVLSAAEQRAQQVITSAKDAHITQCCQDYRDLVAFQSTLASQAPNLRAYRTNVPSMVKDLCDGTFERVKTVCHRRLTDCLEALRWPSSFDVEALDMDTQTAHKFRRSLLDYLKLQKTHEDVHHQKQPIYAMQTLAEPINLRFRYHFHGKRDTNRLDKPRWYLTHVLDAVAAHAEIVSTDVQDLFDQAGLADRSALHEFIAQLLVQVQRKIESTVPQLLDIMPLLAHTIYQALEFDQQLRDLYQYDQKKIADIILHNKVWFAAWKEAERKDIEDRYYEIIGHPDAWQSAPDQPDADGACPTNATVAIRDLLEKATDRYKPLPDFHQRLDFLLTLQLPILEAFQARLSSAVDAIETLSIGIMRAVPGAITEGTNARLAGGVSALTRLVKVSVSARWFARALQLWSDDLFFLDMAAELDTFEQYLLDKDAWDALARLRESPRSQDAIFGTLIAAFQQLATRADQVTVKHVVREISLELKSYIARPWDPSTSSADLQTVSVDLQPALLLFSASLSAIGAASSPTHSQDLFRPIAVGLCDLLYTKLATTRVFSAEGGQQLRLDLQDGWVVTAARNGLRRPDVPLRRIREAAVLLSLDSNSTVTFQQAMSAAWSEDQSLYKKVMAELDISTLSRKDVQAVLKKRPDTWR